MKDQKAPVEASLYDERYYLESCGGVEFFDRYGPRILKPELAYALSRASIRPGMRVLDIGCGRGELLYHVRRRGAVGIGTDYTRPALEIAGKVSGCAVVQCDAKSLPFEKSSFDRIFFLGVMDHLREWELAESFREMERVLKPSGFVLVHTCANRWYYKNWSYKARQWAARALRVVSIPVADPSPPRSEADAALHVNEYHYIALRAFFKKIGWNARIESRPNYKMILREIYGDPLPTDFPLKPMLGWKTWLYLNGLWWPPLKWILAREFFCIAAPAKEKRAGGGDLHG